MPDDAGYDRGAMADPKLTPRKQPRQHRARATVEAIVIAGEQLTRDHGIEDWTTNHVAERAGVSIGSLYQYFPSKESLVVALYLHRREAYTERLVGALVTASKTGAPREVAAAVVGAGFDDAPAIDWAFDLGLRGFLIASGAARKLVGSDQQLAGIFASLMERRGWATAADAPARGAMIMAAIERLLAPLAVDDRRWRTAPSLRATMIATVAAALGPAG